jgi:hypothetical protein
MLVSCENEDDATKVVILLPSESAKQTVEAGEKLLYEIEAYSIKSNLNQFAITSFDTENGTISLLDTTLNTKNFKYSFIYPVPEFPKDSVLVKLKMTASDYENNTQEFNCQITVTKGTFLLSELTGIVLYSGASGRPDAFSLGTLQPFLKSLADSADIDVYDYTNVELNTGELSREWRTNTDVRFSRVNSFNYSTATAQALKNLYPFVERQKYIKDIQVNDIVLLGREDKVVGLLQIVGVSDEEGAQNDFYRFNIKQVNVP